MVFLFKKKKNPLTSHREWNKVTDVLLIYIEILNNFGLVYTVCIVLQWSLVWRISNIKHKFYCFVICIFYLRKNQILWGNINIIQKKRFWISSEICHFWFHNFLSLLKWSVIFYLYVCIWIFFLCTDLLPRTGCLHSFHEEDLEIWNVWEGTSFYFLSDQLFDHMVYLFPFLKCKLLHFAPNKV